MPPSFCVILKGDDSNFDDEEIVCFPVVKAITPHIRSWEIMSQQYEKKTLVKPV
jgi:hypothetical protein